MAFLHHYLYIFLSLIKPHKLLNYLNLSNNFGGFLLDEGIIF